MRQFQYPQSEFHITLHGDVGTFLDCRAYRRCIDHVLQIRTREACGHSSQLVHVDILGDDLAHIEFEDVFATLNVWLGNHYLQSNRYDDTFIT